LVGRHGITDEYIDFQINNIGPRRLQANATLLK
jgi:hypothetical protein